MIKLLVSLICLGLVAGFSSAPGSCTSPAVSGGAMATSPIGDAITAGYAIQYPTEFALATPYTISVTARTGPGIKGFIMYATDGSARKGSFTESPVAQIKSCGGDVGSTIGHNDSTSCRNAGGVRCTQQSLSLQWTAPATMPSGGNLRLCAVFVETISNWFETCVEMTAITPPSPAPAPTPTVAVTSVDFRDCAEYCANVDNACFGDSQQFIDTDACLRFCQAMPLGTVDDTAGDTYGCRVYHVGVAGVIPDVHCPHSGALGGGVCGDYCEVYCRDLMRVCPGEFFSTNPLGGGLAECVSVCNNSFSTAGVNKAPTVGEPTVQCRHYHLQVASQGQSSADIHCVHAGFSGGSVCGSVCESYCDIHMGAGPGGPVCSDYASRSECLTACAGFDASAVPAPNTFTTAGDSLQCRVYHSTVASASGDTVHCEHSQATPTSECVDVCGSYCASMETTCAGAENQYFDTTACLNICETFAAGNPGAIDGNSLACRDYHLGVAQSIPVDHCPHAGPFGGGVCGGACEDYCTLIFDTCTNPASSPGYTDYADCLNWCASFPIDGVADRYPLTITTGNSLQCRAYHLQAANSLGDIHCTHAGKFGGPTVCGTECDAYCTAMQFKCPTTFSANWNDVGECSTACETFPNNASKATAGDSKQCRLYHVGVALGFADDGVHCDHASPLGGGVCSDDCENFCNDMAASCPGTYPSISECLKECAALPVGTPGATAGDNLQCRITAEAAGNCAAASPNSDGTCGDACPTYCRRYFASPCQGSGYTDIAQCQALCAAIEANPAGTSTVDCRAGATTDLWDADDATQCPKAGAAGGVPGGLANDSCGGPAVTFCSIATLACPTTWPDVSACQDSMITFFAGIDDGTLGDTSGNTVGCRFYHMTVAGFVAATGTVDNVHCTHASQSGGGICTPPYDCATFCADVAGGSCSDQYVDCPTACAEFELGSSTDTQTNTASCRVNALAEGNCAGAGFSGGDFCGDYCENYCAEITSLCGAGRNKQYVDVQHCLDLCPAFSTTPPMTTATISGDSLSCRNYHLQAARVLGTDPHCSHAGPMGADGVCGDACDAYCSIMEYGCPANFATDYTTRAGCQAACANWTTGTPSPNLDTSGNTLSCRIYHAGVAIATGDNTHCDHANLAGGSASSGFVCVDATACTTYRVATRSKAVSPTDGSYPIGFTINGEETPELCLEQGSCYTFEVSSSCFHPFFLTTDANGGQGDSTGSLTAAEGLDDSAGVTACAGGAASSLSLDVTTATPAEFYYQCDNHLRMGARIRTAAVCTSPTPSPPTTSTGPPVPSNIDSPPSTPPSPVGSPGSTVMSGTPSNPPTGSDGTNAGSSAVFAFVLASLQ